MVKGINEAKALLKANGYFIDNLWCIDDVKSKFKCSDENAQDILDRALTNEATMDQIWFSIKEFGRIDGLEEIE